MIQYWNKKASTLKTIFYENIWILSMKIKVIQKINTYLRNCQIKTAHFLRIKVYIWLISKKLILCLPLEQLVSFFCILFWRKIFQIVENPGSVNKILPKLQIIEK